MMFDPVRWVFTFAVALLFMVPGCSGQPEWLVTVENQSDVPCSFFVTMRADGSSKANMEDVAKGKALWLIAGKGQTVIHGIKVVRGKEEQVLTPVATLPGGKRYAIVVDKDGKVNTSILDK